MVPLKIMIIRHAEKPNGEPGIMPSGAVNPEALTATGWKRANALVGLFDPADASPRPPLAKPTRLFASGSESLRPVQTITPLAAALGNLPINTTYRKNQLDKLVAAAKNSEGATLIAWQHEDIPAIAALILGSPSGVPLKWPSDRFDLVWVFDRQDDGTWSFTQVPQLVLPGDSSAPIGLSG
jgi:hypothetical protein